MEEETQEHQGSISAVTDIANGLSQDYNYELPEGHTRGEHTADLLIDVCNNLMKVGAITGRTANVEFLLSIVGSYLFALKAGSLEEGAVPPGQLFDESLFPALDTMQLEVEEYDTDVEED